MRLLAPAALLLFCLQAGAQDAGSWRVLPAKIEGELHLREPWLMESRVVVAKGASLTLHPGSAILARPTAAASSWRDEDYNTLVVHGRLVILGTPHEPVVLDSMDPGSGHWGGIQLEPDRDRSPDSRISNARIRGARHGVLVMDGTPVIRGTVFHGCGVGVLCGGRQLELLTEPLRDARPSPEIEDCTFVRCTTGVYVERSAAPDIHRTAILGCNLGVGNDKPQGYKWQIEGLGPRVRRSLLAGNGTAVHASSLVEDSLVTGNGVVFAASEFHTVVSQTADRIAWRRNVIWGNNALTQDEADLGTDNVFSDPELAAPIEIPAFEEARAPFPGGVLGADSPARGTALDGGDPGPHGTAPPGRRRRPWDSAGSAIRRFLVLGPPSAVDPARPPKSAPAEVGETAGNAWWCAVEADEEGGLERSALGFSDGTVFVAVLPGGGGIDTAGAIETNADGRVEVLLGDQALSGTTAPQRFGTRGLLRVWTGDPGRGFLLRWTSDDLSPRLGVAILGDEGPMACVEATGKSDRLVAVPIRFSGAYAGLRISPRLHWLDLARSGAMVLHLGDGTTHDLSELGVKVHDAKQTLRYQWPEGVARYGAKVVLTGLRDVWGRPLHDRPVTLSVDPE